MIAFSNINDSIGGQLAPELKVLFPQITDIAVTRAIFGNIRAEATTLDTVNVALVKYTNPLPAAKRNELEAYLKARLRYKSVSIIDIGKQINFNSLSQKPHNGNTSTSKK